MSKEMFAVVCLLHNSFLLLIAGAKDVGGVNGSSSHGGSRYSEKTRG
jgi:hypothetical protein